MVRTKSGQGLHETLVYSIGNTVCFKEEFSDTVFYVDAKDNFFKPRVIFDSHGTFFTPEMRGGSEIPGSQTNWISNLFETSRYVFYSYGTMETLNKILFDKTTKKKYNLNTGTFVVTIANIPRDVEKTILKDDLSGGPDFNIEFLNNYCSDGKLFSFIDALTLKKYVTSEYFKNAKVSESKKAELKKLTDSLKETDNPVMIVVTPKN